MREGRCEVEAGAVDVGREVWGRTLGRKGWGGREGEPEGVIIEHIRSVDLHGERDDCRNREKDHFPEVCPGQIVQCLGGLSAAFRAVEGPVQGGLTLGGDVEVREDTTLMEGVAAAKSQS